MITGLRPVNAESALPRDPARSVAYDALHILLQTLQWRSRTQYWPAFLVFASVAMVGIRAMAMTVGAPLAQQAGSS